MLHDDVIRPFEPHARTPHLAQGAESAQGARNGQGGQRLAGNVGADKDRKVKTALGRHPRVRTLTTAGGLDVRPKRGSMRGVATPETLELGVSRPHLIDHLDGWKSLDMALNHGAHAPHASTLLAGGVRTTEVRPAARGR